MCFSQERLCPRKNSLINYGFNPKSYHNNSNNSNISFSKKSPRNSNIYIMPSKSDIDASNSLDNINF